MASFPTVYQLPNFIDTCSWLAQGDCRCIWYMPKKQKYCSIGISADENQAVLQLAEKIIQKNTFTMEALQILTEMAERSCCTQYHRNKMWGSRLANILAGHWQDEIRKNLCVSAVGVLKLEKISSPVCGTSQSQVDSATASPGLYIGQTQHLLQDVKFSKHAVLERQTLASNLLSAIHPSSSTLGSVYVFRYTGSAFEGMLKIGFTSRPVEIRLDEWTKCGHGIPSLLKHYRKIRHPERVELLTHFELAESWYEIRWCHFHGSPHIEWFKVDVSTAKRTIEFWSSWMERANPYDRRGHLKDFWKGTVEFLCGYGICITGELMMQIQEVEEGSIDVTSFIDDDELRRKHDPRAKQVPAVKACGNTSSLSPADAHPTAEKNHEVKSIAIKVEVAEMHTVLERSTGASVRRSSTDEFRRIFSFV